jgi:hypothetical protein
VVAIITWNHFEIYLSFSSDIPPNSLHRSIQYPGGRPLQIGVAKSERKCRCTPPQRHNTGLSSTGTGDWKSF